MLIELPARALRNALSDGLSVYPWLIRPSISGLMPPTWAVAIIAIPKAMVVSIVLFISVYVV